jgi:hypothetical protein
LFVYYLICSYLSRTSLRMTSCLSIQQSQKQSQKPHRKIPLFNHLSFQKCF